MKYRLVTRERQSHLVRNVGHSSLRDLQISLARDIELHSDRLECSVYECEEIDTPSLRQIYPIVTEKREGN